MSKGPAFTNLAMMLVDVGTSGCRALCCRRDGTVLSAAEKTYGFSCNEHGFAEQDPETIFQSFFEVMQRCLAETPVAPGYVAIGSVLHSLLLLDGAGKPLSPLSIWADTRAVAQCQGLKVTFERNRWFEKTGCPLSASYPIYRLFWFKEKEPALYGRFRKAVSIKSYLLYRLFGCYLEDHSVASGSGMFNIHGRCWDRAILDHLQLDEERLPKTVQETYLVPDLLSDSKRNRLGLSEGTRWMVGGADGPLAHLGSAGHSANTASLTIGTSGAVRVQTAKPRFVDGSVWSYVAQGGYVSGIATNNGGNVVDWYLSAFFPEGSNWLEIERRLTSSIFDPELYFIPFLFKERDLLSSRCSSAQFVGLQQRHSRYELLRAVLEGIAFNLVSLLERLLSVYGTIEAVALSGSLANSAFLRGILSQTLSVPVVEGAEGNASLLGLARIIPGGETFAIEEHPAYKRDNGGTGAALSADSYPEKYHNWKNLSFPSRSDTGE